MGPQTLLRVIGWRFKKKPRRAEAALRNLKSRNTSEPRPPEIIASKLGIREPTEAPDDSVESQLTPLTGHHGSSSAVARSADNTWADSKGIPQDYEWYKPDSSVHASIPNIEDPDTFQSFLMSGPPPFNQEVTLPSLPSDPDDLLIFSNEPKRTRSPLDLQTLKARDVAAPVESSSLGTRLETARVLPLNGKNSDIEIFPKSILDSSPNGHMTTLSDLTGDGRRLESLPGDLYSQESILVREDHQPPFSDTSENAGSILDFQDPQTPLARSLGHPLALSDAMDLRDPVLISLDEPVFIPDKQRNLQSVSVGEDYAGLNFVAREQNYPHSLLDEGDQSEPASKQSDHSVRIFDVQQYPKLISRKQSRSESIESEESSNSRDRQPLVVREARLHRFRWRSMKTRALATERRTELRELRNEMNDAVAEFVNLSRERWINGSHNDLALKASFEKLQATRDAQGLREEAYNTLEERLDREEYELAELEEHMLENGATTPESRGNDLEWQPTSPDELHLETLDAFSPQQNPLYKEYLSKSGDAVLLREKYLYLLAEHESLLEALEVSQRYGRELPLEDQTTMLKFYAKEGKMSEELRKIDTDVERLRIECSRKGLLPGEEGDEIGILQSSDGMVDSEQAEYDKYPRLLEQPGDNEDDKRSKELLSQFKSGDTGDRITRWLLHKLRSSCSEVELLKRSHEELNQTINTEKWQEEVLYFWFTDSANLPPSAYELEPTLTAVPSSPLADPSKVPPKVFGEKQFIQLVVRSSSLSRSLEFGIWLKLAHMKGRSAISL